MSEMGDTFKALHEEHQKRKETRAFLAQTTYGEVRILAREHGLELRECKGTLHYQLAAVCDGGVDWLLNLYPSTQRMYMDPHHRRPSLKLPHPWTLLDVVRAAIKLKEESEVTR